MYVQPEGVVAPDDVAQDLVVAPVVRRVDDPLLLPRRPRMRAGRRQRDTDRVRECAQLRAAFPHALGAFGEGVAAPCPDLDLRRDQLADEVRLELGAARSVLEVL